ncbi:MAG: phosphate ABC transporter substrate-binding protein PstS [Solirubrobacteraceae bacterium]|nr:phosphate ABC transporter substrate-binding protein PstS [Patulibacter sp.]
MDLNRTHLLGLTSAAAVALAAGLPAVASASNANGALVGAGSTLVAPLLANWSQDFEAKNQVSVTYGAVGSGAGIAQITARTVDFGASDAPLTPEQAAACNGCVQIPWGLTATGLAFNLPGISALKLTPALVASIYEGKITNWNDAAIAKVNKGTSLPNLKITPAFRSDGSGDTYAFTDFLSGVDKGWRSSIGKGTAVSFPAGIGGKGNDGVTAVVSSTPGAIGYISASYIIAHKLRGAALQNAAGKFVYPNLKNIEQAAKQVKKVPANNEMHIVNPPKSSKQAYPLSTFTYVIVPKASPKAALLKSFITYATTTGQGFGAVLDFAPIPAVVLKAANKTIATLG